MRAMLMLGVLVGAVVPDRPDPTPRPPVMPQEQLLGDWLIESGPKDGVHRMRRITATHMLILVDGVPWPDDYFSGTYTVDWSKTPPTFDNTRNNCKGILKIEGDHLTMCMSLGGARPTEFNAKQGHVSVSKRIR